MNREKKPSGFTRSSVKPNGLHHLASDRRQPCLRRAGLIVYAIAPRRFIQMRDVDAADAGGCPDGARRRHLQTPPAFRHWSKEPQTERVVMVEHGLQGGGQLMLLHAGWNLQQHGL